MPDDQEGLWVPGGGGFRRQATPGLDNEVMAALSRGRQGAVNDPALQEMRKNRRVAAERLRNERMQKSGAASLSFATARPRDPMFYWEQNNLPYDIWKPEELKAIRKYCRILYLTHPVIAACIDIFAKYPLSGMELSSKDDEITEFYTTLFFDQLKYPKFLKNLGREYWLVGEAWPFGSFNETLGVWEDDELLQPDDIEVHKSPFLKEERFEMRLPETLRKVLNERKPQWEYEALMRAYPELQHYTREDAKMPVSNILLRQIKFEADTFHPRGVPILMRGFRSVMQEEMLNAAQDAIADRLYTPLILAKLGASAVDLGTQTPWVPTEDDIADFEEALDAALAADFRVLTTHFAVGIEQFFGRDNMPDFKEDFDRLTERQLQVFGLSKTAIAGAAGGETYAGDALNRDYVSQLLTNYQDLQKDFFRQRALVVAEAQEHYDYEERGGKRYPIMEEIWEVDEETGEGRIVEQPKLLVPELKIKAMNMQDETIYRQLVEALRASGVPISMKTRLVNIPIDLDEEIERIGDEQVEQAIAAQEVRKRTFIELRAKGLPIAEDLRADFEPKAVQAQEKATAAEATPIPTVGTAVPGDTMALAPTPEDIAAAGGDTQTVPTGTASPGANVLKLPTNRIMQPGRTRPPESDEMRSRMPKPVASLDDDEDGEEVPEGRLARGPGHIGMRRRANVRRDRPLNEQTEAG
jgi:hypothetical protein